MSRPRELGGWIVAPPGESTGGAPVLLFRDESGWLASGMSPLRADAPVWWPAAKPFINGGTAATIGITIFNPVDVVKTRLQIAGGGNPFIVASRMVRMEGITSLYAGLSAQYLRAWTYQTARLGAYRSLVDLMQPGPNQPTPLWKKACAGISAGAFGALIGNPAELAIIRMQADKTLPEASRRNYRNVGDALYRVVRSEGILALWTGSSPTVVRAMALNCGALASYDQTKEMIDQAVGQAESRVGIACASLISGIVGSVFSLPFDYVKTQIQRMKPDATTGEMPFHGPFHCFTKTVAEHGPMRFYAGLPTYTIRIAPMITFTWLILEQILALERSAGL